MARRCIALVLALVFTTSGGWGCSFVEEVILDQRHSHHPQQQPAPQPQQAGQSQTTSDMTSDSSSGAESLFASQLAAPMLRSYAMSLMMVYFWAGGFWLANDPYQPGEWTKWKHEVQSSSKGAGQPLFVEKAFLKRCKNKNEWWSLKAYGDRENEHFAFEILLDGKHEKLLRMRAMMGKSQMQEVVFPPGENSFGVPKSLRSAGLRKHRVGQVNLTSKAGSWRSDHVRLAGPYGQMDFYFSKKVPGGLVKYRFSDMQSNSYTVLLDEYGKGAMTSLPCD